MTETRTFFPIFEKNLMDPSRDCVPVGFITFVRDEECGDFEPELSLNFKIQDDSGDIEFTIGEEEVETLIAALIDARRNFQQALASYIAGDPDNDDLCSAGESS